MPRIEFSNEFRRFLENTNKVLLLGGYNLEHYITHELDALLKIHHAINLVNTILVDKSFRFSNDPKRLGSHWPKHIAFQTMLLRTLDSTSSESINAHFPNSKTHPYFNLFLSLKELVVVRKNPSDKPYERENKALQIVRAESKQKRFRMEVDAFRKGPDDNTAKLRSFFTQCLKIEETLNFVRIDLYSEPGKLRPSHSENSNSQTVKSNFKKLIDYIRKLLKTTMVGYAWKLSYSASTSYHYQLMIFCIPVDRKSDNAIAGLIGEKWGQLTAGVGIYYWHQGVSLTTSVYEGGSLNWKYDEARSRLRQLSKEVFVNDFYIKQNTGRAFKSFGMSGVIDPRLTPAERKKLKAVREERKKKQKKYFSDLRLPFSLEKPVRARKTKAARSGIQAIK